MRRIHCYRLAALMVFMSLPVWGLAQTPDGDTPAQEDVCAGLTGSQYGLCNAYCEAMDCDSESPNASAQACQSVKRNFLRASGGVELPCITSCPCVFPVPFSEWAPGYKPFACTPDLTLVGINAPPVQAYIATGIHAVSGTPYCVTRFLPYDEFHEELSGAELHQCSVDVIEYAKALRDARDDIVLGGPDPNDCEPIPPPE